MNPRFKIFSADAWILLLSLVALTASSLAYGIAGASAPRGMPSASKPAAPYVTAVEPWFASLPHEWKLPDSGFELFAPPQRPAAEFPVEIVKTEPFGIELIAIRPEPFCVRLLGVIGEGPERRGVFEDISNGEVRLGRPGDTIAQRVQIQSIETHGFVATSSVQRPGSTRPVELRAGSPAYGEEWIATVHDAEGIRDVRAGEKVGNLAEKYQIQRITEAAIVLRRESERGMMPQERELRLSAVEERP